MYYLIEIINVGKWYSNHLNKKIPIIILSEEVILNIIYLF